MKVLGGFFGGGEEAVSGEKGEGGGSVQALEVGGQAEGQPCSFTSGGLLMSMTGVSLMRWACKAGGMDVHLPSAAALTAISLNSQSVNKFGLSCGENTALNGGM